MADTGRQVFLRWEDNHVELWDQTTHDRLAQESCNLADSTSRQRAVDRLAGMAAQSGWTLEGPKEPPLMPAESGPSGDGTIAASADTGRGAVAIPEAPLLGGDLIAHEPPPGVDDCVEYESWQSFPASDPPSWTPESVSPNR